MFYTTSEWLTMNQVARRYSPRCAHRLLTQLVKSPKHGHGKSSYFTAAPSKTLALCQQSIVCVNVAIYSSRPRRVSWGKGRHRRIIAIKIVSIQQHKCALLNSRRLPLALLTSTARSNPKVLRSIRFSAGSVVIRLSETQSVWCSFALPRLPPRVKGLKAPLIDITERGREPRLLLERGD